MGTELEYAAVGGRTATADAISGVRRENCIVNNFLRDTHGPNALIWSSAIKEPAGNWEEKKGLNNRNFIYLVRRVCI